MKNYRIRLFYSSLLALCILFSTAIPVFAWDGTTKTVPAADKNNVYLIRSAEELAWFSDQVFWGKSNINAKLIANIDLSNQPWTPIGDYSQRYRGIFDGNGFTVSGLMIAEDAEPASYVGLFGYLEKGSIRDLTVQGSTYGESYVGGIVGSLNNGTIDHCSFNGTVTATYLYIGGISGYNLKGTVSNCANYGNISTTGEYNVGGIVGNNFGTIEGCYNAGQVCGNTYVGGITGHNFFGFTTNSYNIGMITGNDYVGGIVGCLDNISENIRTEVKNCYSVGAINSGGAKTGGVIGSNNSCLVTNCYYSSGTVSTGIGTDNANGNAVAKTSAEIKDHDFLLALNGNGAAFIEDTENQNGGNPILSWQKIFVPKFNDVTENDWYSNAVVYCVENQLFKGMSSDQFGPNVAVTRGMFVTVLGRYEGVADATAAAPVPTKFSDVNASSYYASHVAWAAENQIVYGKGQGMFDPNAAINREELVTILLRYCQYKGYELPQLNSAALFSDAGKISSWAVSAVASMQQAGIISGKGNNLFCPQDNAKRAEVAAILYRYLILID